MLPLQCSGFNQPTVHTLRQLLDSTPSPASLLRFIHQSGSMQLVLIPSTACSDLPVLVGVQSVEEIVAAVLPRSVRELEDRQQT